MTWDKLFYGYVVVSACDTADAGPETYIFPAYPNGVIADWIEMAGSINGVLDHDAALTKAGYTPIYHDNKETTHG